MSNDAHTPFRKPWKLVGRSGDQWEQIKDLDGNVLIAEIGFELGSQIVAAINAHDTLTALVREMKTALEWCSRHLKKIEEEQYPGIDEGLRRFNSRANADVVIQKAKEAGIE